MQSNDMGIAKRLKKLRLSLGYKISKLARELDISHQAIRKIEYGTVKCPKATLVYKLAKKLKTTPEYILEGKGFSNINDDYEKIADRIPILSSNEAIEWCQSDIKHIVAHKNEYINNPTNTVGKDIFGFKIQTDSMEAVHEHGIPMGAIAICRPSKEMKPNRCELFYDKNQGGVFIREIIIDGKIYLKPLNPQFGLLEASNDVQPIAEVLAFIKLF